MMIRPGSWVMHEGKICIVRDFGPPVLTVSLWVIGPDGEAPESMIRVPLNSIRKARISEIPACRMQGESLQMAKQLGYDD